MQDRNNNKTSDSSTPNNLENAGHGAQGIDKAPGEETAHDEVQFKEETQKGKKVDADLTNDDEKPSGQDI